METNTQLVNQSMTLSQKITGILEHRPVILQLLRFAAIGIINTALDYAIYNFLIAQFGITSGWKLGLINFVGVAAAIIQSYLWNRYWAFGQTQASELLKNFFRLVLVGGVGAVTVLLILLGANNSANPSYFLMILGAFLVAEIVMWQVFGLFQNASPSTSGTSTMVQFFTFLLVSVIGMLLNSGLVTVITSYVQLVPNDQLNANLAKIVATVLSLVWNFIGYKIFVFKK